MYIQRAVGAEGDVVRLVGGRDQAADPYTRARPVSGMTAIEFAPQLTAYSVLPSGDSVTANVAAPV